MENKELNDVLSNLNELLESTNLENVTSESSGYEEVKDGYYLCEVEKAELTISKNSGNPQVFFQMKIVDDGYDCVFNEEQKVSDIIRNNGTKNRKIFNYFPLTTEQNVKRFVTDMLKFEGDVAGESLLDKECFTNSELLEDALSILVGRRLYVKISTTKGKDGKDTIWKNFISWRVATSLGLPE